MARVKIISEFCKSCQYCIKNCPRGVLQAGEDANSMGYKYAAVAKPDACIGCGICVICCPDAAIELYK